MQNRPLHCGPRIALHAHRWKCAACLDGLAQTHVQALDGIGGVDDFADLRENSLNHVRDVGRLRWVGIEHVFELRSGHSRPYGQSEEVDDFRRLST